MAAFEPAGAFPLALLTYAALIHVWIDAAPRRAFWTGWAFGLGLFGAGVSWVYVSLHDFGGMSAPLAAVAALVFCAFLALFPAAAGWLQARIPAHPAVRACLLIPAAWVLLEWLRSWIFTGFPWLSAGYAAAGWPLQGYAPLLGVFGLSFLTLALAGMALIGLQRRLLFVAGLVVILGAGEVLRRVEWSEPAGEPVTAALLQGNVAQDMKFRPERYAATLDTYARLAEGTRAKLIVLPETAIPRFYGRIDQGYIARLEAAARRNGGDLLLGVPYEASPGEYYNSVVSLGVSPRQAYHKTHLVPFGEFIPLRPLLGGIVGALAIPLSDFSRGAPGQTPLAIAGQRVAVSVSYEAAFGEETARGAAQATLLVHTTNVAWFGDSLAPAQQLQMGRLRAVETARMYLTASNTGITAAINRDGSVLGRLPQFTEGRLEIAAQGYTGVTPYVRYKDWPTVVFSLLVLSLAALIARRQNDAA